MIEINVTGTWLCTRAVLPQMQQRGAGRIINLGSTLGLVGLANRTPYTASKGAIVQMTRALALGVAGQGITVNAIAPGYVATELLANVSEEVMKSIVGQIPVGRLGQADEVARCVAFLAADEAGWITGSTLTINGGQFMD